jgi:hypothetical protein
VREMTTVLAHGHMSQGLGSGELARKKGYRRSGIREDSKPRRQELQNSETRSPEITELKFGHPKNIEPYRTQKTCEAEITFILVRINYE